jgi:hypothetical protein
VVRTSVLIAAVALLALPSFTAGAAAPPTVSCDSIVVPAGSFSWRPKRVVLGLVAVPPAYISQTFESGDEEWPYWIKSGLVIRADSPPVHVSVSPRWRSRVAIGWGHTDAVSALRFASCPPSSSLEGWNPYTGGFFLRARSACVPLTFRAGGRSATVRFGVGKRCGSG